MDENPLGDLVYGTLRNDFVRTGIRKLDEGISKCMDINDEMQKIGK